MIINSTPTIERPGIAPAAPADKTSIKRTPAPASAIVHLHMGNPVTNSLVIAHEFLRPHKSVLQSLDELIADGTISRHEFKPRDYKDSRGKTQRMIELTEAGALIAMPFLGGKKSRAGQVRLVGAFLAIREKQTIEWAESRSQVSTGYQAMSDALHDVRADEGKVTQSFHYANEAKMINFILFGQRKGVTRDDLTRAELVLLDKMETRNVFLIARGRTHAERKAELPAYLAKLRTKRVRIAS